MNDRASKALADASLPGEPRIYDAMSKRSGVPLITLYHRDYERRFGKKKRPKANSISFRRRRKPLKSS